MGFCLGNLIKHGGLSTPTTFVNHFHFPRRITVHQLCQPLSFSAQIECVSYSVNNVNRVCLPRRRGESFFKKVLTVYEIRVNVSPSYG
jgi:hypothetical protein